MEPIIAAARFSNNNIGGVMSQDILPDTKSTVPVGKDANVLARERTDMATYRVKLALDRTTLAWIRTALALVSFGFAMVSFFRAMRAAYPESAEVARLHDGAIMMGMALLLLGIAATLLTGASNWFVLRRLRRDEAPTLTRWSLSITVALLLGVIGLAGAYLLFWR